MPEGCLHSEEVGLRSNLGGGWLSGEMERGHAVRVFGDSGSRNLYSIIHRGWGMVWDRNNRPVLAHEPAYI